MKKFIPLLLLPSVAFADDFGIDMSIINGYVGQDFNNTFQDETGSGTKLGVSYNNWFTSIQHASTNSASYIYRVDLGYGHSYKLDDNILVDGTVGLFGTGAKTNDHDWMEGGTGSLGLTYRGHDHYVSAGVATTYYSDTRDEFSNNYYLEAGFTIDVLTFSIGYDEAIVYMKLSF